MTLNISNFSAEIESEQGLFGGLGASQKGIANGVASLDGTGNVPGAQLGNVAGGAVTKTNVLATGVQATDLAGGLVTTRNGQQVLRDFVNVMDYGAIGDNTGKALSAQYPTLTLAQVQALFGGAYSFVTSLSQTCDWAAIQAAANTNIATIRFPAGHFVCLDPIKVPPQQRWIGEGHQQTEIRLFNDLYPLGCLPLCTLTSALVSGTPTTVLNTTAIPGTGSPNGIHGEIGVTLQIVDPTGAHVDVVVDTSLGAGSTSINVNSFTPSFSYPIGSMVAYMGPAYFIQPGNAVYPWNNNQQPYRFDHIMFTGPSGGSLGNVSNRTTGIFLAELCEIHDCFIQHFYAGVEVWNDHQVIEDTHIPGNYYGLDFPDYSAGAGNQFIKNVNLDGAAMAAIHFGGGGTLDTSTLINVSVTRAPMALFKTDCQSAWDGTTHAPIYNGLASPKGMITGTDITQLLHEEIGNVCWLDVSTGSTSPTTLGSSRIRSLGHSWNNAFKVATLPLPAGTNALYQQAWAVVARSIGSDTIIDGGQGSFLAGSTGILTGSSPDVTVRVPTLSAATASVMFGVASHQRVEWPTGKAIAATSQGAINTGELVEIWPSTSGALNVQRATGNHPVYGVALNNVTGTGITVLVQLEGLTTVVFTGTFQLTAGATLVTSAGASPWLADLAANSPSGQVVGVSELASGTNPTAFSGNIRLRTLVPAANVQPVAATVTLVAGSSTVANAKITANSIVRTFNISSGGAVGALSVTLNAGVGFTINSTSGTDTSKVRYEVILF